MSDENGDKKPDNGSPRIADGELFDWENEEQRADGAVDKRVVRGLKKLADLAAEQGTATGDEFTHADSDASETPDRIGSYRILQKLGEGGMGEVFLAEQTEPVNRRVALKVIKQGMDTKQVVARFEAERQALAMMDHPAVARVFEAGATPEGRPYFAMEYVQGVPITTHCDRHKLTNEERLKLFVEVCDGVQHAHQKAIIHRDLKPSNVLVSIRDGKAVPKIIDFGVAKATAQRLTEKTVFTQLGVLIGTPEYMSPEQADLTEQDVDTRTDVYSLGVMLYELLVGALPFDPKVLRSGGYEGIRRKIREEDPPRPSTKLSTLGDRSTESAKLRRVDLQTLRRQLRGDLDWITMRALEKDRARRYGSPQELAADVERHLRHQPVVAGPPSAAYRTGKFVRRHRFGVAVGAVAVVALVGFAITMGVLARRIALEREQVVAAKNDLERVVDFQAGMLSDLDVEQVGRRLLADNRKRFTEVLRERGNTDGKFEARVALLDEILGGVNATDVALRLIDEEILDRAGRTIDEEFAEQPLVAATLRQEISETYRELGLYERARPYAESALATRRELLGPDHPDTLTSINNMARLLQDQGETEEAEPYYREALEGRRRVLGNDHPDTLISIHNMGFLLDAQGRYEEAEPYYREALEGKRRVLGNDAAETLTTVNNLGLLLVARGKHEEAEPYYQEALEGRRRVLGNDHPHTLTSVNNMGFLLYSQSRYREAEPYFREALEGRRRVLGNDHRETLLSITNLGVLLHEQGKRQEAEPYYREALEGRRRVLGDDHPDTIHSLSVMGSSLRAQGRLEEAELYQGEALERSRRVLGNEHPSTLASINKMGLLFQAQGRLEEAERYIREALEGKRRVVGDDHPSVLYSINNLGRVLQDQGRLAAAEPYLREALEGRRRLFGDDHSSTLRSIRNMGALLQDQEKFDEAEALLAPAVESARLVLPPEHPLTGSLIYQHGASVTALGRHAEAEVELLEAHEIFTAVVGADHERTQKVVQALVDLYEAWGKTEKAEEWRAKIENQAN